MKLTGKLLAIQTELKAPKNQFNSFGQYYYRNCEDILEAIKPLLAKYGASLIVYDRVLMLGGRFYIQATAELKDLEDQDLYIRSTAIARETEAKKGMDASQISGSASSYARKYALNGLFLIDDTKDADTRDHGGEQYINDKQKSALIDMITDQNVNQEKFCQYMKVESIDKMPESKYKQALIALKKKKEKQEGSKNENS